MGHTSFVGFITFPDTYRKPLLGFLHSGGSGCSRKRHYSCHFFVLTRWVKDPLPLDFQISTFYFPKLSLALLQRLSVVMKMQNKRYHWKLELQFRTLKASGTPLRHKTLQNDLPTPHHHHHHHIGKGTMLATNLYKNPKISGPRLISPSPFRQLFLTKAL